jgi:pimeloyl-ACP methyl ester carboxylesterase
MLSPIKRGALKFITLAIVTASIVAAMPVRAEPVQIKPGLLRLNGNLEMPKGKTLADGEVLLIVHGMLSHYGQETIAALQKNLIARGRSSLAINLSLGVDDRIGPRTCDVTHDYAIAGAKREVSSWIDWLYGQRARAVDILGFSRGGAQVAAMGAELPTVRRVVLVAPSFASSSEIAQAYEKTYGRPLAPLLADARQDPLKKFTADFLNCRQAPVLGATFLDGYTELPPRLAARTGHPTLVVIAGKDEVVTDLESKLPSDVRKVTIEGSSHYFPDLFGEDAADAIAKFLAREPAVTK